MWLKPTKAKPAVINTQLFMSSIDFFQKHESMGLNIVKKNKQIWQNYSEQNNN